MSHATVGRLVTGTAVGGVTSGAVGMTVAPAAAAAAAAALPYWIIVSFSTFGLFQRTVIDEQQLDQAHHSDRRGDDHRYEV